MRGAAIGSRRIFFGSQIGSWPEATETAAFRHARDSANRLLAVPRDVKEEARADVKRAQSKFARLDSERDQARIARREAFERAREAGLTLREIGEAAELHLTRVREVLDRD